MDFEAVSNQACDEWAEFLGKRVFSGDPAHEPMRAEFSKRFTVLPEDAFNFLCQTGTEVVARVRVEDKTGTVADGALWNEELLPPESILAGLIACDRVYGSGGSAAEVAVSQGDLVAQYATKPLSLQIGGKATTGRGRVRCIFSQA